MESSNKRGSVVRVSTSSRAYDVYVVPGILDESGNVGELP